MYLVAFCLGALRCILSLFVFKLYVVSCHSLIKLHCLCVVGFMHFFAFSSPCFYCAFYSSCLVRSRGGCWVERAALLSTVVHLVGLENPVTYHDFVGCWLLAGRPSFVRHSSTVAHYLVVVVDALLQVFGRPTRTPLGKGRGASSHLGSVTPLSR